MPINLDLFIALNPLRFLETRTQSTAHVMPNPLINLFKGNLQSTIVLSEFPKKADGDYGLSRSGVAFFLWKRY